MRCLALFALCSLLMVRPSTATDMDETGTGGDMKAMSIGSFYQHQIYNRVAGGSGAVYRWCTFAAISPDYLMSIRRCSVISEPMEQPQTDSASAKSSDNNTPAASNANQSASDFVNVTHVDGKDTGDTVTLYKTSKALNLSISSFEPIKLTYSPAADDEILTIYKTTKLSSYELDPKLTETTAKVLSKETCQSANNKLDYKFQGDQQYFCTTSKVCDYGAADMAMRTEKDGKKTLLGIYHSSGSLSKSKSITPAACGDPDTVDYYVRMSYFKQNIINGAPNLSESYLFHKDSGSSGSGGVSTSSSTSHSFPVAGIIGICVGAIMIIALIAYRFWAKRKMKTMEKRIENSDQAVQALTDAVNAGAFNTNPYEGLLDSQPTTVVVATGAPVVSGEGEQAALLYQTIDEHGQPIYVSAAGTSAAAAAAALGTTAAITPSTGEFLYYVHAPDPATGAYSSPYGYQVFASESATAPVISSSAAAPPAAGATPQSSAPRP
ncbi:hypothetical protein GQ42DRAFT_10590 [Ramicandelaber brevisporus]|nr:hypothetical protein GQ42DRAFT_10590 [Ramicandelaber brevisporus]